MQIDPNTLEVRHVQDSQPTHFSVDLDGQQALMFYTLRDNRMIFTHTEVPEAFEGKGIAGRMAKTALDWARTQGYQVEPRCPFVAAYIQRHPEYQDITLGD